MLRIEDCFPGNIIECINTGGMEDVLVLKEIYAVDSYISKCLYADGSVGDGIHIKEVTKFVCVEMWQGRVGRLAFRKELFRVVPDERLSVFRQMLIENKDKVS